MQIIRCSIYSNTPGYQGQLISHSWLIDMECNSDLIEILRFDCFGFSNHTSGRQWGRTVVFDDGYQLRIINGEKEVTETLEKIAKVKLDLAKGNRNKYLTMGLF